MGRIGWDDAVNVLEKMKPMAGRYRALHLPPIDHHACSGEAHFAPASLVHCNKSFWNSTA